MTPNGDALRGRVAVVAGATRGAGRGIAAALGEAGATVVCTGRSSRDGSASLRLRPRRDDRGDRRARHRPRRHRHRGRGRPPRLRPGGRPGRADPDRARPHRRARQRHLGRRGAQGRPGEWNTPIWEHDLDNGLRILRLAIDTHLITSHHLLPLLVDKPGGLLVEVTDGTAEYNESRYRISVFYDLAKVAVNRLAFSQGHELAAHGATAVAITPGLAPLGDDARELRRLRGELARRRSRSAPSELRGVGVTSLRRAAPSPRWRRIPTGPDGTSSRSPPASSRSSTGSPTSTAPSPTSGATSTTSSAASTRTPTTTGKYGSDSYRLPATSPMIAASSCGRDHIGQWLVGRSIQVTSRSSVEAARETHSPPSRRPCTART